MTVVASADPNNGAGWYWVPIDGAKCRHNTDTGIAVRFRPLSARIVITMQGGGACYNTVTCGMNQPEFGLSDFQTMTSTTKTLGTKLFQGIWQISSPFHASISAAPNVDAPNELADQYTEVFIPYCSGDFHAGAKQNVTIPWVTRVQNFQGATNTGLYFHYIVDQLLPLQLQPQVDVILSGYSAGGLGALLNAARLRDMLPSTSKMALVIDSAPPFEQTTSTPIPSAYVSQHSTVGSPYQTLFRPCFLQHMYDTWGLAESVLKDCGADCTSGNWLNPVFGKLLKDRPDVFVALTVGTYDEVLRQFMGTYTDFNCAWDPTEAQFLEGLMHLRAQMAAQRSTSGNYATYFISTDKTTHVAFTSQRYFDLTQATADVPAQPSVRLQDWVQDLIDRPLDGSPVTPMQVGP